MKKTINILVFLVSLLLGGCSSVGYVSFERLEAGDVNYPDNIRRVGVVNNMPYPDFTGLERTSAGVLGLEGDGKTVADTLAHLLASADYFEEVVICDSVLRGKDTSITESYALSKENADSLIEAMGIDVLFSIDRVKIDLTTWGAGNGVKSVVTPVMLAYISGRETPWFAISYKDSIGYERHWTMTLEHFQKDASTYAAYMLMEHLLPSWKVVERNFYASGCVELRDACVFINEKNWEGAYELWKQVYDKNKKGKKRMKSAFNLAVYHEVHDETELAENYIEEALKWVKEGSYDEGIMRVYQLQLKNRIAKRQKLEVQMKRFE